MKYFVFFMLFGGLFFSCNNSKMNETEDVLIQAKFSIDISKEKDFNEEFFLKNKEKLKDLNWEYNNGILTQTITFPNRDLELKNGSVIKTDKNSKAKI